MGLFEGWWVGIEDGRPDRAPINVETWDIKLRESGFNGLDMAVRDTAHPELYLNTNIVSRPVVTTPEVKRVTLLQPSSALSAFGDSTRASLVSLGIEIDECIWGQDTIIPGQDVISLMDVEPDRGALLENVDATTLETLVNTIGDVSGALILWIMPAAQIGCGDPHYGQVLGLARCVRAELGVDFVTLELDNFSESASQVAVQLLLKQNDARNTSSAIHDDPDVDSEFVWKDEQMFVSRMHMASVADEFSKTADVQQQAKHLVIAQPGLLQSIH